MRSDLPVSVIIFLIGATAMFDLPAQNVLPLPPGEVSAFARPTRSPEVSAYLRRLAGSTPDLKVEVIGSSAGGREIVAARLRRPPGAENRLKVMIFCQQHGDEPSGKEAALRLARELSGPAAHLLDRMEIVLIPQANPDGGDRDGRTNAADADPNRDHVRLFQPETRALHDLFRAWQPEVTLDVHEYNPLTRPWITQGFVRGSDEMLGWVTHPDIDPALGKLSADVIFPEVAESVRKAGFSLTPYLVGQPFGGGRLRHSTVGIDDGRQGFGIYNTLSFILEGRRYGPPDNRLQQRVQGQAATLLAFLEALARHREAAQSAVREARRRLTQAPPATRRCTLRADHYPDPARPAAEVPVFDLYAWQDRATCLEPFHPEIRPTLTVIEPAAYIVRKGNPDIFRVLAAHGIRVIPLAKAVRVTATGWRVTRLSTRQEEEIELPEAALETTTRKTAFEPGDGVVPVRQEARLLIPLLLEPLSSFGLAREAWSDGCIPPLLREGADYPVARIETVAGLEALNPNLDHP